MDEFFEEPIEAEGPPLNVGRYVHGVLRRWILVGAIAIVLFAALIVWVILPMKPLYEAKTLISFETFQGGLPESLVQNRMTILKSRTFAEEATARLGLTLEIKPGKDQPALVRQDVFSTFYTTTTPVSGHYRLRLINKQQCHVIYENEKIHACAVENVVRDTLQLNGLSMQLRPDFAASHDQVEFFIHKFQSMAIGLQNRTRTYPIAEGSYIMLILQDRNPNMAAEIVNMFADLLVAKSREIWQASTSSTTQYLENQLDLVKRDLDRFDNQLKKFRGEHKLSLDQEMQQTVDRIAVIETQIENTQFYKNEMKSLIRKLDPSQDGFEINQQLYIYREIANHPAFDRDAEMKMLRDNLAFLSTSRADMMKNGLPEINPGVIELSEKIIQIQDRIYRFALKKLDALDEDQASLMARSHDLNRNLESLPGEELRFIRLNRERQVFEALYENILNRLRNAQINEAIPMERISIMDPAIPDYTPITGQRNKSIILSFLASVFMGIAVAVVMEMADKSIKSRDEATFFLRIPILGAIPKVKFDVHEMLDSEKAKSISSQIVTHDYSPTPVGEAYRALRTSILFNKSIGKIRSLAISSAAPNEGKSFTATNLTITMAQQKSKTLLIDADLRRGVLHNTFNCRKKPGLTNYLTGVTSLEEILQETYIPNLSLIACGSMIPNPSELLGSERMQKFIQGLAQHFDLVVFDTPPLLAASDAVILGTFVDGVALVVKAGGTQRDVIKRKLELFQNVHARMLGTILNQTGVEVAHEGYSYYSY